MDTIAIPFTQYLLPDGRAKPVTIERPVEIGRQAHELIDAGFRFECEVLATGDVSLTCETDKYGDSRDVLAIAVATNGPGIPGVVDDLVREAVENHEAWSSQEKGFKS